MTKIDMASFAQTDSLARGIALATEQANFERAENIISSAVASYGANGGYLVDLTKELYDMGAYLAIGFVLGKAPDSITLNYVIKKALPGPSLVKIFITMVENAQRAPLVEEMAKIIGPVLVSRTSADAFCQEILDGEDRTIFLSAVEALGIETEWIFSYRPSKPSNQDILNLVAALAEHIISLVDEENFSAACEAIDLESAHIRPGTFPMYLIDALRQRSAYRAIALALGNMDINSFHYVLKKSLIPNKDVEATIWALVDATRDHTIFSKISDELILDLFLRARVNVLSFLLQSDAGNTSYRANYLLSKHSIRLNALATLSNAMENDTTFLKKIDPDTPAFDILDAVHKIGTGHCESIDKLGRLFDIQPEIDQSNTKLMRRRRFIRNDVHTRLLFQSDDCGAFAYPSKMVANSGDHLFSHPMHDGPMRVGIVSGGSFFPNLGTLTPKDVLITEGSVFNERRLQINSSYVATISDLRQPAEQADLVRIPTNQYHLPGRVVALGSNQNFFHFIVNYLPKLWLIDKLKSELGSDFKILLNPEKAGFHASYLSLLGIDKSRIHWAPENTTVTADEMIISTMPLFRSVGDVGQSVQVSRKAVQGLRRRLHQEEPTCKGRRIFLRRGQDSKRNLINEAEVEATLTGLGFECVDPAIIPARAQLELMREASMVAGVNGAQLGLAMFAPDDAAFIDLTPEPRRSLAWFTLPAAGAGLRYYEVAGHAAADKTRLVNADFSVDPALLTRSIKLADAQATNSDRPL